MPIHFERETNKLEQAVFSLSTIVQKNLQQAIQSMETRDSNLAQEVIEADHQVDQLEIDVEEECLKILALYQPVSADLRLIVSFLKSDNELERIGDLSRDIAKSVLSLCEHPAISLEFDWKTMTERVEWAVKNGVQSLLNLDVKLANEVCQTEEEIDGMYDDLCSLIQKKLRQEPKNITSLLELQTIGGHFENIADHAKKIAEDAIYNVSGEIVRHKNP